MVSTRLAVSLGMMDKGSLRSTVLLSRHRDVDGRLDESTLERGCGEAEVGYGWAGGDWRSESGGAVGGRLCGWKVG